MIRFERRNVAYFGKVKAQFDIRSTEQDKFRVIERILHQLSNEFCTMNTSDVSKIRLCLDEVITNSIEHGNNFDSTKKIKIKYIECEADTLRNTGCFGFAISDEGQGIKSNDLPDYNNADFYEKSTNGRGLLLIANISDELVYFEKTRELVFKVQL